MHKFRTIEVSDPRFESNHLRFITVKSSNLKGRGDICVYAPADVRNNDTLPIVILLHGVYGSAWSWAYNSGVHLAVNELIKRGDIPPMILAMPSDGLWGDGSAYLPHSNYNFESWIIDDVTEAIISTIKGAKKESPLFISGLSMGGFGALRIGAKYGDRFKAISGHSPITSLAQIKFFAEEPLMNYCQKNIVDEDVLATFKQYKDHLPLIKFDCGKSDLLLKYNRELHAKMDTEGIPHLYTEYEGGHDWAYWSAHIMDSLEFFAASL